MNEKENLRKQMRAARRLAAQTSTDAALELFSQFKKHCFPKLNVPAGATVAGYIATDSEINPRPILDFFARRGAQLCLPAVIGADKPLEFRAYQIGDELSAHASYKVFEPAVDKGILVPDILLVPLLGFDRRGNRIGYGKGYYDRTLANLRAENKNILAIGLAYSEQEVAEIPANPHDQPLNIIVTPHKTIYCPAR